MSKPPSPIRCANVSCSILGLNNSKPKKSRHWRILFLISLFPRLVNLEPRKLLLFLHLNIHHFRTFSFYVEIYIYLLKLTNFNQLINFRCSRLYIDNNYVYMHTYLECLLICKITRVWSNYPISEESSIWIGSHYRIVCFDIFFFLLPFNVDILILQTKTSPHFKQNAKYTTDIYFQQISPNL